MVYEVAWCATAQKAERLRAGLLQNRGIKQGAVMSNTNERPGQQNQGGGQPGGGQQGGGQQGGGGQTFLS